MNFDFCDLAISLSKFSNARIPVWTMKFAPSEMTPWCNCCVRWSPTSVSTLWAIFVFQNSLLNSPMNDYHYFLRVLSDQVIDFTILMYNRIFLCSSLFIHFWYSDLQTDWKVTDYLVFNVSSMEKMHVIKNSSWREVTLLTTVISGWSIEVIQWMEN